MQGLTLFHFPGHGVSLTFRRLLLTLMLLLVGIAQSQARMVVLEGHTTGNYSFQEYYRYLVVASGVPGGYRHQVEVRVAKSIQYYLRDPNAAIASRDFIREIVAPPDTLGTEQTFAEILATGKFDAILAIHITGGSARDTGGTQLDIQHALGRTVAPEPQEVSGVLFEFITVQLLDVASGNIIWAAQGELTAWSGRPRMYQQTAKLVARKLGRQLYYAKILFSKRTRDKHALKKAKLEAKQRRREEKLRAKAEARKLRQDEALELEKPADGDQPAAGVPDTTEPIP